MSWIKDPDAVLDYRFDWSAWLATGETISTSIFVIAPTGLTAASNTHDGTSSTVWLTGGVAGTDYVVTNRVTTSAARTDDRSIRVRVTDR